MAMPDSSTLNFGEHPDVVFRRSPLSSVICQIRFNPITSLLTEVGVVGFQEALRESFPEFSRHQEAEIGISDTETSVKRRVPIWRMSDDSGRWRASIAVGFVSLETRKYKEFSDFLERLMPVVSALDRTVHPGGSTRLGLRFVNQFTLPKEMKGQGWSALLDETLVGLLDGKGSIPKPENTLAETRFRDENGDDLVIRYGLPEDSTSKYLLDMDYFTSRNYTIASSSALFDTLMGYSRSLTALFHQCLTEDGYEYLQPKTERETMTTRLLDKPVPKYTVGPADEEEITGQVPVVGAVPVQFGTTENVLTDTSRLEKAIQRAINNEKNINEATRDRAMALRYLAAKLDGLAFKEVSQVLGTPQKRLAAYLHGTQTVPKALEDRISILSLLLRNLHQIIEPAATGKWFRTRIPALDGSRPIDLMSIKPRIGEVLAITESYLDGDYS